VDHDEGPGPGGEFAGLCREECLRLLASVPVGRLIFTVNALPTARPVNFVLADGLIVLRTAADSAVAHKAAGAVVAFEADEFDPATFSGWSVVVTGCAQLVTDAAAVARYQAVPLMAWAPGARDQFVTITTDLVEGRRVRRSPP
jgi:uncharacterized protein